VRLDPARQQPPEIDHRITERRQLPVDQAGDYGLIVPVHDVRELEVTVNDTDPTVGRQIVIQPAADPLRLRQGLRLISVKFAIAFKLRAPPFDLPLVPVIGLAVTAQTDRLIINIGQRRTGPFGEKPSSGCIT
jgi:hypothetical protein